MRAVRPGSSPEAVCTGKAEVPETPSMFYIVCWPWVAVSATLCRILTLWRVTGGKEAKQDALKHRARPGPQLPLPKDDAV